jgi:hypothetical protein
MKLNVAMTFRSYRISRPIGYQAAIALFAADVCQAPSVRKRFVFIERF